MVIKVVQAYAADCSVVYISHSTLGLCLVFMMAALFCPGATWPGGWCGEGVNYFELTHNGVGDAGVEVGLAWGGFPEFILPSREKKSKIKIANDLQGSFFDAIFIAS